MTLFLIFMDSLKNSILILLLLGSLFIFKNFAQNTEMEILHTSDPITLAEMCRSHPDYLLMIPSIFPFKDKVWVSSPYGVRRHPIDKRNTIHDGIDFACPKGTQVIATANGSVLKVEYANPTTGNSIVLSHLGGYMTFYGHLEKIGVRAGNLIHGGDIIGISGETGKVTGPHLHYSIIKNGKAIDPLPFCFIQRYALEESFE